MRICSLFVALLLGLSLIPPVEASQSEISLTVNVNAYGSRVMVKIDDTSCAFGFYGLPDPVSLVVLDTEGREVASQPLGIGNWSMKNSVANCDQSYNITLPASADFTFLIAPYFQETYLASDLEVGTLDIELTREEGDAFPLPILPEAGEIEGTDQYRVVGTFELHGEQWEDFISAPIIGCSGTGGYGDIKPGAQITIKDQSGDIVAVSELEPDPTVEGDEMMETCRFIFIAEVPEATFYTFTLGRRGDITYSFDDLVDNEWKVDFGIGS